MSLPVGVEGLQIVRAQAQLEAAGGWDPTPTEIDVSWANELILFFTYDENPVATDGAFDFQIEVSPYHQDSVAVVGSEAWFPISVKEVGSLTPGTAVISNLQTEIIRYTNEGGGDPEGVMYGPLNLAGSIKRLRVPCRESGDQVNYGALQVMASLNCLPGSQVMA